MTAEPLLRVCRAVNDGGFVYGRVEGIRAVNLRVEGTGAIAPAQLGAVERLIGFLHQLKRGLPIVGKRRYAQADGDVHGLQLVGCN